MSQKKEKNKVVVAMSGGVDSSVVAKMMVDEGHDVVGLFLKLWSDPTSPYRHQEGKPPCFLTRQNRCCDYKALADAREVADKLGIKFYVIDAVKEFKDAIVDEFISEYKKLRTPNPCIKCNEYIKFDLLLKKAIEIGSESLATGHYAKIEKTEDKYKLFASKDDTKDQSYMLYRLNQEQLSKVIFPIGDMLKVDVREMAIKWDLPVKEKPESQEICFFGDRDYRSFLKRYLDEKYFKPGKIVDIKGNILGTHKGLVNYTIGQRKGVLQNSSEKRKDTKVMYVVGFDVKTNRLVVGEDDEVYSKEMVVTSVNWINQLTDDLKNIDVKIRYRHEAVPCELEHIENKIKVLFDKPQRAITPGQSAVFYNGEEVLGGGIIEF